ncbi:DUF3515 family protein [Intrasporangium flavum]|uniref:DUF3515 family protein n=1 Tax=Intrasporangium flavum TaxID=1428657 RepID=UPI00096FBF91|nr:DUF3515 family protein [Intrasporangium flavum]
MLSRACLAGLAALALGACSRATEVALAPQASAPVCRAAEWPANLSGHARVDTSPADPSVAAWGDPALIARCGLEPLAPTTDECVTVDGVDWVVRRLSDGTMATTYGRDPAVEVLAPAAYGPVPLLLPAFGELARSLPATGRHCS